MASCNICGGTEFRDFNGRALAQCGSCKSLERHRVCLEVYKRLGLMEKKSQRRLLHLAPEKILADYFVGNQALVYFPSDSKPERYPWTKVLRLVLPNDLRIFPDGYFDFVVHNHVLEHIPGHWKDHLAEFKRLLAPGGSMIFTVPGPVMSTVTEEGGEHLLNDSERLAKFGQVDHVRRFGSDLPAYLAASPNMKFEFDSLSAEERSKISIKPNSSRVMIWTRLI